MPKLKYLLLILFLNFNLVWANSLDMLTAEDNSEQPQKQQTYTPIQSQSKAIDTTATQELDNYFFTDLWLTAKTTYYKWQLHLYKKVSDLLLQIKTNDGNKPIWILIFISFIYGVIHAVGPGHGKVLIASYLTSENTKMKSAVKLAFIAAQVQSLTAIVLVFGIFYTAQALSSSISKSLSFMYYFSAAVLLVLASWLIFDGAKKLLTYYKNNSKNRLGVYRENAHTCSHNCAHQHLDTKTLNANTFWEEFLIVLSIGLRPCTGSIMIVSFSLALGIWLTGLLSAIVIGLGVGLTMIILAIITLYFRDFAIKIMQNNQKSNNYFIWIASLAKIGAACIILFLVAILLSSESLQGLEAFLIN